MKSFEQESHEQGLDAASSESIEETSTGVGLEVVPETPQEKDDKIRAVKQSLNTAHTSIEVDTEAEQQEILEELEQTYFYLLTQPYSIESQRYAQLQVDNTLFDLKELVGPEKAGQEFAKIQEKLALTYGREAKIHYSGWFDRVKDKLVQGFKDIWDIE